MVARQIRSLFEGQAEQAAGSIEGGGDDAVELQVGLDLAFVEIELGLADLLRVVAPIPGLQTEILSFTLDNLLQKIALPAGGRARSCPDLVEQACGLRPVSWP